MRRGNNSCNIDEIFVLPEFVVRLDGEDTARD